MSESKGGPSIDQQLLPPASQVESPEALPPAPTGNPFEVGMYVLPEGCDFLTRDEHETGIQQHIAAWGPYFETRFGGNVLRQRKLLEIHTKQSGAHSPGAIQARQNIAPALVECRKLLQMRAANPLSAQMIDNYPLPPGLWSAFAAAGDPPRLLGLSKVSDEHLIRFIEWNSRMLDYCTKERHGDLAPHIQAFKDRLSHASRRQHLPVDHDVAMARIDQTAIAFTDPLLLGPARPGQTNSVTGTVSIHFDTLDPQQLRRTVFHELFHRISGKAIALQYPESLQGPVVVRSGLTISAPGKDRMRWMGEAFIDVLTELFLDANVDPDMDFRTISFSNLFRQYGSSVNYHGEGLILVSVLDGPRQEVGTYSMLEAFFEDYDPRLPVGERSPKQRQLYDAFTQAWGTFGAVQPFLYDAHQYAPADPYQATFDKIQRLSSLLRRKGV